MNTAPTRLKVVRVRFDAPSYRATGTKAQLIEAGLAQEEWFPQGRKRVVHGSVVKEDMGNWWFLTKHRGDLFSLKHQRPPASMKLAFELALQSYFTEALEDARGDAAFQAFMTAQGLRDGEVSHG